MSIGSRGPTSGSQLLTVAGPGVTARARAIQIGLEYQPRLPSKLSEPIDSQPDTPGGPATECQGTQRQRDGQSPQVKRRQPLGGAVARCLTSITPVVIALERRPQDIGPGHFDQPEWVET